MDAAEVILVALAVAAGATLQSALGFGFALLAGPAVFAAANPAEALTILIVLGITLNVLMISSERRPSAVETDEVLRILGWAVPGVAAGVVILIALSKPALQVIVGIAVVVAAAIQARGARPAPREGRPIARAAAGLTAGTLTTTTATNGPPLVLFLQSTGARPETFRDNMAALLLGLNVMGAIALVLAEGRAELPDLGVLVLLLAMVAVGRPAGRLLFDRLDHETFRVAGLGLIVASGAASVVAGVT